MHFTSKINPVLFIAEVGSNHEGNYKEAIKLVLNACDTNSDVVKLQIFTAKNLVAKKYDNKRFQHFKKLELSVSQNKELFRIIKSKKKKCSASIWDVDQIDIFKSYIDIYKVGSGDIHNFEIIKKIVLLNKPLIISTGLSTIKDISKTLSFIKSINKKFITSGKLAILHCNTAYPTPKEDSHLGTISNLKKKFNIEVGYSDHTVGNELITYAYLLGSKIIEKHFSNTINKKSFRDHFISLNKEGVQKFLDKIKLISKFIGIRKDLSISEKKQKNLISFRRSIYAKKDIKKGELLSTENLICLRPYKKVSSSKFFQLEFKKSKFNFKKGDLIKL
jgi:N,N'-diacetyllegionaminate synthase